MNGYQKATKRLCRAPSRFTTAKAISKAGYRVGIPEAVRKRAFDPDQLAQCPNCERILYVG